MTRVPGWSAIPSGNVTRSIFFGSFSGSIRTAATTGIPDSARPSFPVKQTCLASACCPFRQNFVHGEKMSWGCSPPCGWACWGLDDWAGFGAGAAGLEAALGAGCVLGAGGAGGVWANALKPIHTFSTLTVVMIVNRDGADVTAERIKR